VEDLVAQDREPVEQLRALLMGDRDHRGLEARHMSLERDGDPIAEPALHARGDRAQEPGGRRGRAEADRRGLHEPAVTVDDALAEQLEPERHERVGQGGEQGQGERHEHEARLVAVPEPAQAPHGRQRGGQVLIGGGIS